MSNLRDSCNIEMIGTNECASNSYTDKNVAKLNSVGKRIDHILYRPGRNHHADVLEYNLPLPNRVPGKDFSYSDHEAVYMKIRITDMSKGGSGDEKAESVYATEHRIEVLEESIKVCSSRMNKLRNDRMFFGTMALIVATALYLIADLKTFYGLQTFFTLSKFILCAVIVFFIFMSTIWNIMERHGILSGKLSMEITLNHAKLSCISENEKID